MILVADNLVVPPEETVVRPWVDTSDCQRMLLVVRGPDFAATGVGVEFYTPVDGVAHNRTPGQ